ncbi:MAG TPA: MarR family transcriptional regulator [Candidatus Limnocylindrales bacterium]|nr:MarR family transcriptional regulator [Candidatus Limnocylindrales bacterium]
MSTPDSERDDLVAAILRSTAELSAGRAAFTQVVAERFGLAATDVECLGLLSSEGPMAVGRLGELTALTTGATTRMVDRLEQAGYVRRVPDPADRRRVIVEPVAERTLAIARAFDPLDAATRDALSPARAEDIRAIRGFLEATVAGSRDAIALARAPEAAGIAAAAAGGTAPSGSSAPVASATQGRLVFVTAVPRVTITSDPALGRDLYRARFVGAVPSARVRDGVVTIRYPRFAWFDFRTRVVGEWLDASAHWRKDTTDLVLNDRLPWAIELRGGATSIDADLRGVRLESFDAAGGTGKVRLTLGVPSGVVRIRLRGGAGELKVLRPSGTPVRLRVAGGYRSATLDGVAAWAGGRIDTPGAEAIADRYEIDVAGGSDRVSVTAVDREA